MDGNAKTGAVAEVEAAEAEVEELASGREVWSPQLLRSLPYGKVRRVALRSGAKGKGKKLQGRPKLSPTPAQWERMCFLAFAGCNLETIAEVFDCSKRALGELIRRRSGRSVAEWKRVCKRRGDDAVRGVLFSAAMRAEDDPRFLPALKMYAMKHLGLNMSMRVNHKHSGEIRMSHAVADIPSNGFELDYSKAFKRSGEDSEEKAQEALEAFGGKSWEEAGEEDS